MSAAGDPNIGFLMEMGFPEAKAQKALRVTGNMGLEAAMEWILSHPDDDGTGVDEPVAAPTESTIKLPPLTDEERKAQAEKLEQRRVQLRIEREENEKKLELEREKQRRSSGKEILEAKEKAQRLEMQQIAEERRREKEEDRKAKERIKNIIAEDRARKKAEEASAKAAAAGTPLPQPVVSIASFTSPTSGSSASETRIQVRMLDGKSIVQKFGAQEPLSAVRLYCKMNRQDGETGDFGFQTNFPMRKFTDEDMDAPLSSLGLVPSATLIAIRQP
ncbi:hypothetical protein RvY_13405 [Ramazzottius varieornatus]|uniref:UBX domain-containing protein n=1 Tax=Ramazzottius varieornatus TaxID=947166 RepID=A0A1D1VWA7_RAMVA|nr:hypothetical protein RvY_13405 [Ramazzottius varieornatus]